MSEGRILIADDEPAFRRLCGGWLERAGWRVETAENGDAAVARFAQGGIDLVLLDLVMPPTMTPEAGLDRIDAFRGAPVIVLTGHAQHDLALQAVERGVWDFLAKPVDPDMLRFVVGRALEKAALERELRELRARMAAGEEATYGIVGSSEPIRRLRDLIRRIGPTGLSTLVLGPSGAGKELVARALHDVSPRAEAVFVPVHCGALPADLLESELFGHLKGSFTGADRDRPGLVETADGGTLFLDEVGEMPPAMQVKLLRFLQDGAYMPVGGRETRRADVRVIAATHRDLDAMVAEGAFREDLYYRLRGMILRVPSLAERPEDIGPLARRFLAQLDDARPSRLAPQAVGWLMQRSWRGNVRELRALIQSAAMLGAGEAIGVENLEFAAFGGGAVFSPASSGSLPEQVAVLERRLIVAALDATGGNHTRAAQELGVSRVGLLKKMDRLGLRR